MFLLFLATLQNTLCVCFHVLLFLFPTNLPNQSNNFTPVPVDARSKECVCGCRPALMAIPNPPSQGYQSFVNIVCFSVTGLCEGPISHPGESYRACMFHWVWSGAVATLYTYRVYVEEARLKIRILLKTYCIWISNLTFPLPSLTFCVTLKVIFSNIK